MGKDDYLMALALAWALSYAVMSQIIFNSPSFASLRQYDRARYNNMLTMASICGYLCALSAKTSVGFLLLRVLDRSEKGYRWFIGIAIAGLCFNAFTLVVTTIFPTCSEEQYALKSSTGCLLQPLKTGFVQTRNFYGVFIDIAFSLLPLLVISQLSLSKGKKIALSILMGLGWLSAVFLILRSISAYRGWSSSYRQYIATIATALEQALVMICGSLPAMIPLWQYFSKGEPIRPSYAKGSHKYVDDSKRPLGGKNSVSTVEGGSIAERQKSTDDNVPAIRVDRQFEVTSTYDVASPV